MARFLVMPGLNELIDAFARIPEGPLRASVIAHARVIADQYSNAPPEYAAPDPLIVAAHLAGAQSAPLALAAPEPKLPKGLQGPEAEVIRRRKKGQHPQQIQAETGHPRAEVDRIIAEAKKAGVEFPNIRAAKGRPMETKVWHTSLDSMRGQGLSRIQDAALRRGISPEEYLRRKLLAVDMAMKGEQYPAIEAATKSDQKTVSLWLSNARAAGIKVPYMERAYGALDGAPAATDKSPATLAPEINVIRPARFYGPMAAIQTRHRWMVEKAAERRGMTPEAYLDLQESIVRQREQGVSPQVIAEQTGEGDVFVKDTLAHAKERGAIYPPVSRWTAKQAS